MLKRFRVWSFFLVALLSSALLLGACGYMTSTPAPAATVSQGLSLASVKSQPALGVNSALAQNFPADTGIYVSLNTDSSSDQATRWQKVTQYLSNIPGVKDAMPTTGLPLQADMGNYETDIKPWLGNEVALGVTDLAALSNLASGMSGGKMPTTGNIPVLLAASVKDKAKLETYINDTLSKSNLTATTETYNGATLRNINLFILTISIGYNDSKLFIGGSPAIVKAAFDQPASASLAGNDKFKTVAAKLPAANMAFFYGDVPNLVKTLNSNPDVQKALNGASFSSLGLDYMGSAGATLAMDKEGMRVDSYQTYDGSKAPAEVQTRLNKGANPNTILNVLPEKTFFFVNGRDGKSAYENFVKSTTYLGDQGKQITDGIKQFETESGLNVQNDLASLFPAEFALFAQSVSGYVQGDKNTLPVGIGFLTKVSDKASAQTSLDKIAAAVEKGDKNGEIKFQSKTVNGVNLKQAVKPGGNISLNLGIVKDYAFFSASEEQTQAIIDAVNGGKSFLKGPNAANFTAVRDNLLKANQGYGYLDLQEAVAAGLTTLPADQLTKTKATTDKLTEFKAAGFAFNQSLTEGVATLYLHFPGIK